MPITNSAVLRIAATLIGEATTSFANANAYIGVGNSATAFAATQTDLLGTALKKAMVVGYPTRSGAALTFRSTFGTSEANFTWNEWGVFNGSGAGTAGPTGVVMLNRKVENLGTKTSAEAWQLTVTVTPTAA